MKNSLTIGHRLSVAGLVLVATVALVLTTWVASSNGNAATTSTSTSTSDGDRAQLAQDLKAARDLDGQAKKDALTKIREDAKSGGYGDQVEQRIAKKTDRRSDRRAVITALLPEQLQSDLAAAKAADPDQRKAMMKKIRTDALAGVYGDQVKAAATLREQQRNDRKDARDQ